MNRKQFLRSTFIGLAGISLASPLLAAQVQNPALPANWAWLDGSTATPLDEWKALFDRMLEGNIRGLLVNGSNELYEKIGPSAQQTGIQLHAWRWTMNRGNYMADHPEWYAVNRLGQSVIDRPPYVNYYRWLCPSQPEVRDLLRNDYAALAQIPGLSGVHLDYVRYCDVYLPVGLLPKYNLVQDSEMPEYDYCYCPLCRSTFKQKHGYDPMDQKGPTADRTWHLFRLSQLTDLVQDIARAVHQADSLITAAVFPTPEMSRRMVRQDWSHFGLDGYMPMLYQDFYLQNTSWIGECIAEARKEVDLKVPIYAGLMISPAKFTPEVLQETISQVRAAGGQGISAFTAHRVAPEQLRVLQKAKL